ncbi:DnaD domain-containing protein [Bacillus cereus]|uniref:DnaD domain-containing protein n=1 Tax=Bacillus cereus TaxID=1396 RepID=UPI000BF550B4|nr:DnaD domain protein [Bacillus cereus]PEY75279.1 replication protein [Bacillus cereus]PGP82951.1 replication protein [Bacillus cereus]PGU87999.1 replication protein [Bacillus cereus]
MGIFRVKKDVNYSVIHNTPLRDEKLSWRAKGLLAYMLSLPDDWTFHATELSQHAKDGKEITTKTIQELKKAGYLKRYPVQDPKTGKISHWETAVYEVPSTEPENQSVEKPVSGKTSRRESNDRETSDMENHPMEKQTLLSTDNLPSTNKQNTNKQNTNKQSSSSIFSFYENNFGILNSFIAESISQWVNDTSEELVQAAMERALKQQKKWNYAEGILKQWVNKNILTLADVNAAEIEFKNKGKKGEKNNAGVRKNSSFIEKYDFE